LIHLIRLIEPNREGLDTAYISRSRSHCTFLQFLVPSLQAFTQPGGIADVGAEAGGILPDEIPFDSRPPSRRQLARFRADLLNSA